jgi:alkylation response protein AidB-like acyl-CoA dehydrogenase
MTAGSGVTEETGALLDLTRQIADAELRTAVEAAERSGTFPRQVFRTLGKAGLLSLPYPEEFGGGGQPYEVYLRVVEELASAWLTVGLGVSVHTLTCYPLATAGTRKQQERWLPAMLGGDLLGAYCLSEPHCGSDAAALRTRAEAQEDGGYRIDGVKAWISHAGQADFYTLFARTSGDSEGPGRSRGISCFYVPASTAGVDAAPAEHKMGMRGSTTAQMIFSSARIAADHLIGAEGQGFSLAMSALDSGRLGIAACSTGLARAALETAVNYARERRQFGKPVAEFQGVSFMLADMATAVEASRALYLEAARRKDAGLDFSAQAAMAKLFASDTAMRVATDAVQVLGGYGYVEDFPAERFMREAKAMQIVEGTNQIQRMVIGRWLGKGGGSQGGGPR